MPHTNLITEIEKYVSQLYKENETEKLVFHNLSHTKDVVKHVEEILATEKVSSEERVILLAAAWFHDTGHLFVETNQHEQKSIEIMTAFLQEKKQGQEVIDKIGKLIAYSEYTRDPENNLEEIFHDADTYHIGTADFKKYDKQLKKEETARGNKVANWKLKTLQFLESHKFYTKHCQALLEEKKQRNISKLRLKTKDISSIPTLVEAEQKTYAIKTKGIQTMMRIINDNHVEFSSIADNKANLLISVNAIMISVILTVLVRRLEVDTHLIIPTIIFLVVSVITIVLAILSTKPKVTAGIFDREAVLSRKVNMLFFGSFHKTKVEDYEWGMRELMNDPDYLYSALVRDVHQLGAVLARKYRLISIAYSVFMYGIILIVLSFAVAIVFGHSVNAAPTPL